MKRKPQSPLRWADKAQIAALRALAEQSQRWVNGRLSEKPFRALDLPILSEAWAPSWPRGWEHKNAFERRARLRLSRINYGIYSKAFDDEKDYRFQRDHPEAWETRKLRQEVAALRKECARDKRADV